MRRSVITILLILLLASGAFIAVACTSSDGEDGGYSGNDVVSLRVYEFPLTQIYQGDDLDLSDCYVQAVTVKGARYTVPVTEDMVSGYDKLSAGTQTLTITYAGKTTTVALEVIGAEVQGISIAELPDDVSVVQGASFDLSGIKINIHYQTTTVVLEDITYSMLRGYSEDLEPGEHTIYIGFANYEVSFVLTVLPRTLTKIEIVSKPKKLNYFVGGDIDLTGLSVKCVYDNATTETVNYEDSPEDFEISYDFSEENAYSKVTVTYMGKSERFNCAVAVPTAKNLTIDVYPKTVGIVLDGSTWISEISKIREGDKIDWSTGKATVVYEDGKKESISLDSINLYYYLDGTTADKRITKDHSFTELKEHVVYICYGNSEWATPMHIAVEGKKAYRLLVADSRKDPAEQVTNKVFVEGQMFTTAYLRYNTLYDNGTYEFDENDVSTWASLNENDLASDGSQFRLSLNACKDGYQTINFSVGGVTAGFKVKVIARVAVSVSAKEPYRNYYKIGSELDLDGSSVYVEYNDNTVETLKPIPQKYISIYYDGTETDTLSYAGDYIVKVNVTGKESSFTVHAVPDEDYVTKVTFAENGYNFDSTYTFSSISALVNSNIRMLATKSGSNSVIFTLDSKDVELLTEDDGKSGRKDVMFRYYGTVFTIKTQIVGRQVSAIEVTGAPDKTVYVVGKDDELDLSGIKITRTFNDGTSSVISSLDAKFWTFSGFEPDTVGIQTITATYSITDDDGTVRSYFATFQVEVATESVLSISFDDKQPGMESVTVDGVTRNAYKVTYKDDINTTYLDEDTIGDLYFDVEYASGEHAKRTLKAGYLDYDKHFVKSDKGGYFQQATISYGGCDATLWLYVSERTLKEIRVKTVPDVLTYAEGQTLKTEGGYIERIYDNGESDVLPMTSGLIAINGYSQNPFANVQGGTKTTQTVTLIYGERTTAFDVTTYRKLTAEPKCGNATVAYGSVTKPTITIAQSIAGFTVPDTEVEFLVDGEWSTDAPVYPGVYPLRIHVLANEYYNESWVEEDTLKFTITRKFIMVTVASMTKTYGEADADIVYTIEEDELVGNDVVELEAYREEGEDVKYTAQGGYGTYEIFVELKDGQNQNALYSIGYGNPTLTIYPKRVEKNKNGAVINVDFITPNNYNKQSSTVPFTGSEIQSFGAQYTDAIGAISRIDAKDILYYDANGVLLDSLPREKGKYTVKISGNYSFEGKSSLDFEIV